MGNYNKSFNFRNGVQVDNDNFIVNPNGLVGIGTSIPREFLDVHGTAKVTGLVTATNLTITGVSTFYSNVNIGSGITLNASTGIVSATAFYGSAVGLTSIYAIAVDGWYISAGTISTTSKVGIGTDISNYSLQVGQDPITGNGLSIDALTGNVNTTGILTAPSFVGNLTGNVTGNINSSGVSTFSTLKVGTGVTISGGIVTATSFVGSLTGTATTTTNIPNLTGAITSNNTTTSLGSFTSSQLAAALSDETGSGANVFATSPTLVTPALGIATATSIVVGSGVTINSGGITASAGIITASGFVGTLTGSVVGIASTARDLTSDARVSITHIASQTSSIGISTVSTRLYTESIGVGTNSPSSDIHIRRSSVSRLQVTSDTEEAIIAVGRSTTLTGSNGALRFGNTSGIYPYSNSRTLDIINYDSGNINNYLHLGSSGSTGSFNWFHGQSPTNLMTLTNQGRLGLGVTLPTNTIHVSGTSTVSGDSYVGGNFYVNSNAIVGGNLTVTGNLNINSTISGNLTGNVTGNLTGNVNSTSGISTFNNIKSNDSIIVDNSIGIGTDSARSSLDVLASGAIFGTVGIGTTTIVDEDTRLYVVGNSEFYGDVSVSGIATITGQTLFSRQLSVSGVTTSTSTLFANQLSVSGVSTFAGITTSTSTLFANQLSVSGVSTFSGITTVTGTTLFSKQLNVSGVSTLGVTTTTSLSATQISVVGVTTSQNGFTSGIGVTNPVKITVSGNILTFTVTGVGSTSLTLF